ncbi:hypothetical protein RBU61_13955 [Tissierella sp. MB52-C2]|uniref:2'-5' RNA ligase family protein n=1 Tax=Tissierella sp. MB52-C2 TaxID=3070999 RepID=UPI00280BC972|nr:hypothetical protein [Tissierella sp. MB52-C2]WMM24019.1 hypothetical protein RBU61_13955 [Tissierella sp. MB52-C2]
MDFQHESYIVLDLPSPVKEKIYDIRNYHKDTLRASLPVEITVAGSSGVGVIEPGQDKELVFNIIKNISMKTSPILASFKDVLRFPGTDLFVFTLKDEERFRLLHEEITKSGIKFKPNRFPYKPHCTLRSRTPISDKEVEEIMGTKLSDEFILDTISIYMVDKIPLNRLYTVKLSGK